MERHSTHSARRYFNIFTLKFAIEIVTRSTIQTGKNESDLSKRKLIVFNYHRLKARSVRPLKYTIKC